jgi:hypothetical protein
MKGQIRALSVKSFGVGKQRAYISAVLLITGWSWGGAWGVLTL